MKVHIDVYNDIKYKAEMEPMFIENISDLRDRAIKAIQEYRRARDGVKEFYKKRKVYEDFLSELEPLD